MIVYAVIYMGEVLHWYVDASRAEFWRREGYQVIEFSLGLRETGPFQKPADPPPTTQPSERPPLV
ncbi:hypothetical protein IT882_04320 [Microbacterium schleiferi]|uniref:Uncharacterized protein n=1 Tax=Microbacterium schleiferi TaxID=69362 RepID=A0A7S8MY37_9MICO|nr:hypothetical protein [Microbacterium schleiferi]QPE05300.1 hypothetical protein IT882_04320 [Microbacterium schleiferi]